VVDTLGLLLDVLVHAANVQDRDGAKPLLNRLRGRFPRLELIGADCSYRGPLEEWTTRVTGFILQIVRRDPDRKGFYVLPRRWVVERTFGWFGRYRRLSKDDEEVPQSRESMIYIAMIHLMVRRLAPS